jgi:transposase
MSTTDVLPAGAGLSVTAVTITPDLIAIATTPTASTAVCPRCGSFSDHVHSHYVRTVADLPWHGRRVVLRITVRRFRCRAAGCERSIFCERLPAVLAPHARTTDRLATAHRVIGFALGGEAGSRLARHLAVPTSGDTLLRRVKASPLPSRPTPRVLGVDDFAFRKWTSYGTILMDLERRVVVDLLPDRAAGTLAAWLKTHPGVEVVSRDRATAYAQAVREAAPTATQVADRFHLVGNLRQAVERALGRQTSAVRRAFQETQATTTTPMPAPPPGPLSLKERAAAGKRAAREERFDQVRQMHRDGISLRRIAAHFHMRFRTVQKYLRADVCPRWHSARKGIPAPSPLDPYQDQVRRRVADGLSNARALFRDLQSQGYAGGYSPVRKAVHRLAQQDRRIGPRGIPHACRPVPSPRPSVPSARRLSFAVARRPDRRSPNDRRYLERLAHADPGVNTAVRLVERFLTLTRTRSECGLDSWLADAAASKLPEFQAFARRLRQDEAAIRAGLSLAWSNGPVEGANHRLKLIKRQMYGRAGFDLLKTRVLNSG